LQETRVSIQILKPELVVLVGYNVDETKEEFVIDQGF